MPVSRADLRNIAIIAHVDHGKTTLVDGMLKQTNVFRANQEVAERVLDSNDLERERGITILAKNTGVLYGETTINLVDTPGHADFGGEVERVMNMVDGVLLLVDAVEGPIPQTRFVLQQALAKGHRAIVVVNKVDRPAARLDYVVNATFDLFIDLGATDEQAEFPVIYTIALDGRAGYRPDALEPHLGPLFDTIVKSLPAPLVEPEAPPRMLITSVAYDNYIGKIGIGRLWSGTLRGGQNVIRIAPDGTPQNGKVNQVFIFRDLRRVEQPQVSAGDICALCGLPDIGIGDTIADPADPTPLPPIHVEEPTVRMTFAVNDSPFAGRDGQYVTSRQLRARLQRELEGNVALRVEDTDSADRFLVSGRGELHLAILIETMRREGYEFSVSKPEVIFKTGPDGKRREPVEHVFIEVAGDYHGAVSELVGKRRGTLLSLRYGEDGTAYSEYLVPTRGMLGFRQPFLMGTRGTGVVHTLFYGHEPYGGDLSGRGVGSLVALETGVVTGYALVNVQERGLLFVTPEDSVYGGQVVGQYYRNEDLVVNVCKAKHLTNHRKSFAEITVGLNPARIMSLDEAIEYIGDDELLEVTPKALRIRKRLLDHEKRKQAARRAAG
ncbi:MAG: translational GTPase TypA [Fimbriimonadaceae bacterium]|nr:translational GTPase TypA [Fimbriimonadaceae bacterium]